MFWILGIVFYIVGAALVACAFLVMLLWTIFIWSARIILGLLGAAVAELAARSGDGAENRPQARFSNRR